MQKTRSREDLLRKPFLSKTDISNLLDVSWTKAARIYGLAEKIDVDHYGQYRIEPTKVRITSVCKVIGISIGSLQKLFENKKCASTVGAQEAQR